MFLIRSFLFCGFVCLIGQLILEFTDFTPGHLTSLFVSIGALLDIFDIYDKIILYVGGGASLPITSFGHSLIHGALITSKSIGYLGIFTGMFLYTSAGIVSVIVFSFIFSFMFKPKQ